MRLNQFLSTLGIRSNRPHHRRPRAMSCRTRLFVEAMEERTVPSISDVFAAEAQIESSLASTLDTLQQQVNNVKSGDDLKALFQKVQNSVDSAAGSLNNLIAQVPGMVGTGAGAAVTLLETAILDAEEGLQDVSNDLTSISGQVTTLTGSALNQVSQAAGKLISQVEGAANGLVTTLNGLASGGTTDAARVINFVSSNVNTALQNAGSGLADLSKTLANLETITFTGVNSLVASVQQDVNNTLKTISDSLDIIVNTLKDSAGKVLGDIQPFLKNVTDNVNTMIDTIKGTIGTIEEQVKSLVPTPDAIQKKVMDLVQAAKDELDTLKGDLDSLKSAVDKATQDTVSNVMTQVANALQDANAILQPLEDEIDQLLPPI